MKPWDWMDQPGMEYKMLGKDSTWPNAGIWMLTEEQRAFIVAACRAAEKAICPKCGGFSREVPLKDYCKCEKAVNVTHPALRGCPKPPTPLYTTEAD